MDWLNTEVAEKWRSEGKRYASQINAFVHQMLQGEHPDESELTDDARDSISHKVINMVQQANLQDDVERLRVELPAATWPLSNHFQDSMQPVQAVCYLNEDTVLCNTGLFSNLGQVYTLDQRGWWRSPDDTFAGCSSNGDYVALANGEGVRVLRKPGRRLEGEQVAFYRWEGIQNQIKAVLPEVESLVDSVHPEWKLEKLIPLDQGQKLLLQSQYGIYLIEQEKVTILHPDVAEIVEHGFEVTLISMGHAAVSVDDRWIAWGSQMSSHIVLDRETNTMYEVQPESSYPHCVTFSGDSEVVWFNACHFYNGVTIQVHLANIVSSEQEEQWPIMDENARVYAMVETEEGMVIGDAYGYLYCINREGQELWRHFVGSTIYSLAVSAGKSKLAVGTYGGMLHILDLHSESMDEYGIGTGTLREQERYIMWREQDPLRW
ncbi:hypothetical protein PAECIP112173_01626 [Paenibacillus sp. JJ-100]|uniref:hypothetical protein n=1 Tax=Paenibacillus sp. JJ-100 TaxID=2974896 RepID=UPI0022FF6BF0|nr:hypothetical protein [Paenibacillus sp. JJ-100]CAI6056887.1 hypothetical protein PAECIP112173_01626 [Paenibacillus sp. JJ-100]